MNVLITCGNSPIMNEVVKHVRDIHGVSEIFLVDAENISFDHNCRILPVIPRGAEEGYATELQKLVISNGIGYIFVCSDEEALSLSKHQWARDISHIDIFPTINLVLDKYELHRKLALLSTESLVPFFVGLSEVDSVKDLISQHGSLIIRPITGRGSRGLAHLISETDETKYPLGITVENYNYPSNPGDYFLTAYMGGDKYSADCIFDKGQILSCMIRNNGTSVKYKPPTMYAITTEDPAVFGFAKKVGNLLQLDGFHQIECGKDVEGNVKIIEINPRLDATLPITACYDENIYEIIMKKQKQGLLKPVKREFKRFYSTSIK